MSTQRLLQAWGNMKLPKFMLEHVCTLEYGEFSSVYEIGLLQLAITWYKIRHAGGQAHYYSRTGTLKQRGLNQ